SAAHVSGPTSPSTARPLAFWNSATAVRVSEPNLPSEATPTRCCTSVTNAPVEPGRSVGLELELGLLGVLGVPSAWRAVTDPCSPSCCIAVHASFASARNAASVPRGSTINLNGTAAWSSSPTIRCSEERSAGLAGYDCSCCFVSILNLSPVVTQPSACSAYGYQSHGVSAMPCFKPYWLNAERANAMIPAASRFV